MEIRITEQIAKEALEISRDLWMHPELSAEEYRSADMLAGRMEARGFRITKPFDGMETAFVAEWPAVPEEKGGAGGHIPAVAFLAEYDALPGYGELSPDGSGNAHACGHNWISACAFAAAMALKEKMEEEAEKGGGTPVRILLIGTPAEETWGGKIKMAREGAIRQLDLDAAFESHLSGQRRHCFRNYLLALANIRYIFHGKASHASVHPENGINALDALNLTFSGIACLRQHVLPATKLHGYIVNGGEACNIIPETGVMDYYVRAAQKDYLEQVVERVHNCARGAAMMTGCTVEICRNENTFYDMKNNDPLNARAADYLKAFAGPEGPDAEPLREDDLFAAPSGDVGNVSYETPSFYGVFSTWPVSGGADIHDKDYVAVTDSPRAHELLMLAAGIMASAGHDILTDQAFRDSCWKAFRSSSALMP